MRRMSVIAFNAWNFDERAGTNRRSRNGRQFRARRTDRYLAANAKEAGGLGKFHHSREPASIDNQTVIRPQPGHALFVRGVRSRRRAGHDHAARCRQALHVDDGHRPGPLRADVAYDTRPHTFTQKDGRHAVRLSASAPGRPNDSKDIETVHKLQDAIKISQKEPASSNCPAGRGEPDEGARCTARAFKTIPDFDGLRPKDQVDPVQHLIGTAAGWGGNPDKDANYMGVTPAKTTARRSTSSPSGRAGRCVLVGQRLQRQRLLREESYDAYR